MSAPTSGSRATIRVPASRAALAALLIAAAQIAAACGGSAAAESSTPVSTVALGAQDVATVVQSDITTGPIISGSLTAGTHAVVRAEAEGAITATYAERGQRVTRGAVLARIEDRAMHDALISALSQVRALESAVELAARKAERLETLLAAGAVSSEQTEEARHSVGTAAAELVAARARFTAAAEQLGRATVRAPISGVVSVRGVNTGDVVQHGMVLYEVLDPSTMRLDAAVPSAQLEAIHVGAAVTFTVSGYAGRTFTGRIERVSPAADGSTRQVPIEVSIANGDHRLVSGLFAEGRIAARARNAIVAPADAVVGDGAGSTAAVLRLASGRVEKRDVRLGARDDDRGVVEIVSGLAAGDTVLVAGARGIAPGTLARLVSHTARAPRAGSATN